MNHSFASHCSSISMISDAARSDTFYRLFGPLLISFLTGGCWGSCLEQVLFKISERREFSVILVGKGGFGTREIGGFGWRIGCCIAGSRTGCEGNFRVRGWLIGEVWFDPRWWCCSFHLLGYVIEGAVSSHLDLVAMFELNYYSIPEVEMSRCFLVDLS